MDDNAEIGLFQGPAIKVENVLQNQEEAEDLEDQKRRQAEIQHLLTKAMDEFNYDEQSTINSSSNISIDESYPPVYNKTDDKYKNASYDDQLKVLYEIRVREVKSLTEKVEHLQGELNKARETSGKKILLLEAENERTIVSLKQSQALVVGKNEEIIGLQNELSRIKSNMIQLEESLKQVIEEKETSDCLNKDLLNQLSVMHTGITTNTISNRQILEQHHAEVSQLHAMLDAAHIKAQKKENECKELQENLKEKCNERDEIMAEKCSVINRLTESLENAQQQCRELLQIIETISQENKTLKLASTRNELTDSIRIMGLADKTEMVKALQKELEKTREVQRKQQTEFEKLQETCTQLSENFNATEHRIEQYKSEISSWTIKNQSLEDSLMKRNNELQELTEQLTKYKKACAEQILHQSEKKESINVNINKNRQNKMTEDQYVQVSEIFYNDYEREKEKSEALKLDLEAAHEDIEILKHQLSDADQQISKLSIAASLEIERDKLIKTLQEKAAQFERIITEKHNKLECITVGINTEQKYTENQQKPEILQAKFEADLIQKEIQLRTELQNEYDLKFLNLEKKVTRQENCNQCEDLLKKMQEQKLLIDGHNEELNTLKLQRQEDRDAVANLVEEWRDQLIKMELENKEVYAKYLNMKNYSDELALKIKTREDGDSKLYAVIKRECEETIKLWNKQMLSGIEKYSLQQQNIFQETQRRIEKCTDYYDKEVHEIEMQFLRKKEAMEQS